MALPSIWKLNNEIVSLFIEIQNEEGVLTPELEERLTLLRTDITSFTQDSKTIVQSLSSDIKAIDEEIERLAGLKEKRQKLIEIVDTNVLKLVLEQGQIDESSKAKIKPSFIEFELGKAVASHSAITMVDEETINDSDCLFDIKVKDLTDTESKAIVNFVANIKILDKLDETRKYPKAVLKKRIDNGETIEGVDVVYRPKLQWK